ncbi:GNAT family N-acetyltransferase [Symbiobacterium terraclitae]|uniref:GNAT family N-acetyltransferase n=1 Tax=Symbiobacterium terraclitae TaxID=557451 RepID=UPI0035B55317
MHNRPLTPDLLPQAVDLWNRALGAHFPMRPGLLLANLWEEPNFDAEGSRAVLDGDRLVGMIALKRRTAPMGNAPADQKGWISALVVDPDAQGRGLGSALLRDALEHLRRFSTEPVGIGGDPGHFFPGIPLECRPALDWFARRGAYLGTLACDLANREIADYAHPGAALEAIGRSPEVVYRPLGAGEEEAVLAFMRREFPGRWAWEMEQHLSRGGDPEDVMVAVDGGEVVGFARIHTHRSRRFGPGIYWAPLFPGAHGGLGPIGVGAAQPGRGIGLGLLSASIAELRRRGVESAVIDWTVLVRFYGIVGFRPWKWYVTASLT